MLQIEISEIESYTKNMGHVSDQWEARITEIGNKDTFKDHIHRDSLKATREHKKWVKSLLHDKEN